ncbi:MAG: hypothetical protein A3D92_18245 [Bacteroidetes bacterium RIFCSPHIGHO2_02_FULL_44_7]|nr:MAG: hypothetical protein A3D92_18245 [Bacteroidetes bacterium RIFCSPHIGHO2_02_FULL_44_7]
MSGPADFIGGNGNELVNYDASNQVKYGTKLFRYDLRFAYSRVVSRKLMVGTELSYEHMKLPNGNGIKVFRHQFSTFTGPI